MSLAQKYAGNPKGRNFDPNGVKTAKSYKSSIKQNVALNAVPFSSFGTKNRGLFSMGDQQEIAQNIERHQRKLGGVQAWAPLDENGDIAVGAVLPDEDTGLAFVVSDKGLIEIDQEAMDYKRQLILSQQRYVDTVMQYLVLDNETAMQCLNMSDAEYINYTAKNSSEFDSLTNGMYSDLNVNCSAEYLEALPADSKEYSLGLAKLRLIARAFLPKLKKRTGTKSIIHANDEK